jgi:hypothetical protein
VLVGVILEGKREVCEIDLLYGKHQRDVTARKRARRERARFAYLCGA